MREWSKSQPKLKWKPNVSSAWPKAASFAYFPKRAVIALYNTGIPFDTMIVNNVKDLAKIRQIVLSIGDAIIEVTDIQFKIMSAQNVP